jgi:hypothetical protein
MITLLENPFLQTSLRIEEEHESVNHEEQSLVVWKEPTKVFMDSYSSKNYTPYIENTYGLKPYVYPVTKEFSPKEKSSSNGFWWFLGFIILMAIGYYWWVTNFQDTEVKNNDLN